MLVTVEDVKKMLNERENTNRQIDRYNTQREIKLQEIEKTKQQAMDLGYNDPDEMEKDIEAQYNALKAEIAEKQALLQQMQEKMDNAGV